MTFCPSSVSWGRRTRAAYENADREALERLANTDYRLGGLYQRLDPCRQRLLDHCAGKPEKIEEPEEPVLALHLGHSWGRTVFPGVG